MSYPPWLENSLDDVHGGGDWSFTKMLLAPTKKQKDAQGTWPGS
jgi:hypothetical protein